MHQIPADSRSSTLPLNLTSTPRPPQETLDVWAPLANRVGLWNMKAPLEDLAFRQLRPGEYAELRERLEVQQRPETLVALVDRLRAELDREGIGWVWLLRGQGGLGAPGWRWVGWGRMGGASV